MRKSKSSPGEIQKTYLLVTLLALGAILSFVSDGFFTAQNLNDLLVTSSYIAIFATGLMVVLVSGGIDISFTAVAAVSQYVMMSWLISHGGNWFVAFCLSAVVGALLGAVNAVVVHYLRIQSIIVTIATLNVYFGLLIFFSNGDQLYELPDWFSAGITLVEWSFPSGDFKLSLPIIVLCLVSAGTWFLLNRTALGRQLYAIGSNPDAAERVGFPLLKLRVIAFGYTGVLAGVSALVQAQLTHQVAPSTLVGRELEVFAAVVLGGVGLT